MKSKLTGIAIAVSLGLLGAACSSPTKVYEAPEITSIPRLTSDSADWRPVTTEAEQAIALETEVDGYYIFVGFSPQEMEAGRDPFGVSIQYAEQRDNFQTNFLRASVAHMAEQLGQEVDIASLSLEALGAKHEELRGQIETQLAGQYSGDRLKGAVAERTAIQFDGKVLVPEGRRSQFAPLVEEGLQLLKAQLDEQGIRYTLTGNSAVDRILDMNAEDPQATQDFLNSTIQAIDEYQGVQ